ncbi:MAG: NAD(+) diphosphatase [Lachnospiraceae bacterium]|nr:NAD(+) diphosphatase [Lachnospiraceae bacterium]
MIQDLKDGIYHNEYKEQNPSAGDYIIFAKGRSVLMKKESTIIKFPHFEEIISEMVYIYLFQIDINGKMHKFFLGEADLVSEELLESYAYEPQNVFRSSGPDYMAFAGITACQLANWYASVKYCGTCGTALVHDKKERMMRCPKCGAMHYPKISPAVIVGVIDRENNKLLLTKYAGREYKKYALIAGFAEIGETIEDTVKREVYEETGIHVKNVRYYKSQPWSFTDTLLFGFYCDLDGDGQIRLDEEELSVGEWLSPDEIPMEYDGISLTNEMIMRFKNGLENS